MRILAGATALAIAALAATSPAGAQESWAPEGPVQLLMAFRAGGGADTQARRIAEAREAREGWEVVPVNVTGRGGLNALRAPA